MVFMCEVCQYFLVNDNIFVMLLFDAILFQQNKHLRMPKSCTCKHITLWSIQTFMSFIFIIFVSFSFICIGMLKKKEKAPSIVYNREERAKKIQITIIMLSKAIFHTILVSC